MPVALNGDGSVSPGNGDQRAGGAPALPQHWAAAQLRQRALFLAAALVLALGTTAAALFFGDQAQRSARLTFSRELASTAITQLDVDPQRSILLALEAVRSTSPTTAEAEAALHQAVQASRTQLTLRGHTDRVLAPTFRPDGAGS